MKKVVLFLLALTTVALVGCGNAKKEEVEVNQPTVETQGVEQTQEEPEIDPTLVNRLYQSDISALFQDYLKNLSEEEGGELADYRIDDINVLSDEEKKEIVEMFSGDYFMTDVLASVTFSVKPADPTSMFWQAGNGDLSGDWVVNKSLLVTLRDGQLTNIGTGW